MSNKPEQAPRPTLREALPVWVKVGLLSFGGPTGQLALLHRELVEKRRWISDARFLHALNFCMVLPGPEAQQMAIYTGWLLHGIRGGILAGLLFVLPGALLIYAISILYVFYGDLPLTSALFSGVQPAVVAIVASALLRIAGKALRSPWQMAMAAGAFCLLFFANLPFPWVVLGGGIFGLIFSRSGVPKPERPGEPFLLEDSELPRASVGGSLRLAVLWLGIWLFPLAAVLLWAGPGSSLTILSAFLAKAAVVTFGGAYAVLPYVAQQAVENYGWLDAGQMMDGLALAETTPGPLILVLQFVGFLTGWNQPGTLSPFTAATLGALLSSWMTFAPGFLFIFAGAPWMESLRGRKELESALQSITAVIVGVMLNLAVWFAMHVAFPKPGVWDWPAILLSVAMFWGLRSGKAGILAVLGIGAVSGLARHFLGF